MTTTHRRSATATAAAAVQQQLQQALETVTRTTLNATLKTHPQELQHGGILMLLLLATTVVLHLVSSGSKLAVDSGSQQMVLKTDASVIGPRNSLGQVLVVPAAAGAKSRAARKEKKKDTRKFLHYTSSAWEELWLQHIDEWTNDHQICQELWKQTAQLKAFFRLLCSAYYPPPNNQWCILDDTLYPLWFNTGGNDTSPIDIRGKCPFSEENLCASDARALKPAVPEINSENDQIFSKFTYRNEETGEEYSEYIEPLMSHLRFPIAKCLPVEIQRKERVSVPCFLMLRLVLILSVGFCLW